MRTKALVFADKYKPTWRDKIVRAVSNLVAIPNTPAFLPSEMFSFGDADKDTYTWEKWRAENKVKHPVRWFLSQTIPTLWRRYILGDYAPWSRLWYWIRCHTYNKYHLVDIRCNGRNEYKWGYIDPCEKLMLACFAILKEYIEEEQPLNLLSHYTYSELEENGLMAQQLHYEEAMALYHYWTVTRTEQDKWVEEHCKKIDQARGDRKKYNRLFKKYRDSTDKFDAMEDEMLIRMMKIRKGMWT